MADQPSIRGLANRLKLPQAMARRIAITDLTKRAEPEAIEALLAHLPRETDHKALLRIIDHLGEKRHAPAMAVLITIRNHADTHVEIAHAAMIACDRIERGAT